MAQPTGTVEERGATLVAAVSAMLESAGVAGDVVHEQKVLANHMRFVWERKLADHARRARVTPVPTEGWPAYELFGSRHGSKGVNEDSDGRQIGDLDYLVRILRLWLVDLHPWNDLPRE
jgi:hypothetical protein